MKLTVALLCTLFWAVSLTAQIVNIPDPNFKNALVNTPCFIFGPGDNCADANISIDFNGNGEVDVDEASGVKTLCVSWNNINSLEGIEAFTSLEKLQVVGNNLTTLDLSQNINLIELVAGQNNLTSINISQCNNLQELRLGNNNLTEIDLSGNPNLNDITISSNELSSIDFSNNTLLKDIALFQNNLTHIDVSMLPLLENLQLSSNSITTIDISQNLALSDLNLYGNQINTLDIRNNNELESLIVSENPVSNFDLSNNTALTQIGISNTLFEGSLDFSNFPDLFILFCENTAISALNIQNGDTNLPNRLKVLNTPNLFCIQVDDAAAATAGTEIPYSLWEVDPQVVFSEDCETLGITENNLSNISLYPNPTSDTLHIKSPVPILKTVVTAINGKKVLVNQTASTINTCTLSEGIYFISIHTNKGIVKKQFVKKH